MTQPVRSLFIGHGAPSLALSSHPAADALRELGHGLPLPKAVVVVSPHRPAARFEVGMAGRYTAWHDFSGFAPELYELEYGPPGAPELAVRACDLIQQAGLDGSPSEDARIDHGIWVPLRLMWPGAQVPVLPVATTRRDPRAHLALGRALRPLIDDGCLVMGTGSITHNLMDLDRGDEFARPDAWAAAFDGWIAERVAAADVDGLCDYRQRAPGAVHAHPSDEHLLPLFVALGAAGTPGQAVYRGFAYGNLSMASYAFS